MLIKLGFSAVAIGNRVGHESQTITYHYAHMFPTEQLEMADLLNTEFEEGTQTGGADKENKAEPAVFGGNPAETGGVAS